MRPRTKGTETGGAHQVDGGDGVVAVISARNGAWLVEWSGDYHPDCATSLEAAAMAVLGLAPDRGFVGPYRLVWMGQRVWHVCGGHPVVDDNAERS